MRHKVYGKHLGRDKNQRTALFRGLVRSLILQGHLTTTEAKAKAIKGLVDRLISKGRENTNASRRVVESNLPQKEVSKKLLEEIAPSYKTRASGFTQVVRLGNRAGDGAMLVKMTLISEDQKTGKSEKSIDQSVSVSESQNVGKAEETEEKTEKKVVRKPRVKKETK